ncbi:colicin release lysis protein [Edwardsiella tarda]|uniref:Colicin release lysis protein n=1 Tax=Edwardsiella tarda ATCC 15947 = NBRC 105688 TaxID=667121 RepID=A0AC61TN49_EDWTA|nr:colicin release lysis protein [Edwardsiella tarda]UCQ02054.1 colicin release lysis protein [Edwardsiella tarda ATCC 15947 = NBRC 105688]
MYEKKEIYFFILFATLGFLLSACQANYIHDIQGGTVAPSSSSDMAGIKCQ